MNLYKFGYTTNSGSEYQELSHETASPYADFSTMVYTAAKAVADKERDGELFLSRIIEKGVENILEKINTISKGDNF